MSRRRGEPIEVWLRDGKPARFVWRGRLYTVLAVLEHWSASRERPQEQQGDPASPGAPAGPGVADAPAAPSGWESWRVEASPGKNMPSAVYGLRHEEAGDRWLLSRSWDRPAY